MRSNPLFPAIRAVTAGVLCSQFVLPVGVLAQQAMQQKTTPMMQDGQQAGAMDSRQAGVPLEQPEVSPLSLNNEVVAAPAKNAPLTGDAKILLVLNRFTYGPRPGDLEKAREIGLTEWFHRQLNPMTIDDRALEERLEQYPAMKMPLEKMFAEFPSQEVVRAAFRPNGRDGDGNIGDASGRALFAAQEEAYRRRRELKEEAGKAGGDQPMDMKEMRRDARQNGSAVSLPATPEQMLAMTPDERYKLILKLNLDQQQELRRSLSGDERARLEDGMTPRQTETLAAFGGPAAVIAAEDVQTKLLRDIYSERQLQEVMVDFWLNHFNVYLRKSNAAPYFIAEYQRDVVRPFALGKFSDLLLSTAQSVAMLDYLDQFESVGPHSQYALQQGEGFGKQKKQSGLNENYAREVMELHSIGVDGGYTQKDVTELAKVLTGWTISKGYERGTPTRSVFDPMKHEPGSKTVLGHVIKENGAQEGRDVLLMLAASPQCARFISQQLATRFVNDAPPKAMVDRMTSAYLASKGDIRTVLAAIVNSPEFFRTTNYQNKVKTPQDFVVSAVRATGAEVTNPSGIAKAMADLGEPMYGHIAPDGYPIKSEAWNSTTALVSRMNFSMALAANRVQGVHTDLDKLLGARGAELTAKEKQDGIESKLLHTRVSERTEALIARETTADPAEQRAQLKDVAAVRGNIRYGKGKNDAPKGGGGRGALGMPDASGLDLQAALATGLVLGSPEFQRR